MKRPLYFLKELARGGFIIRRLRDLTGHDRTELFTIADTDFIAELAKRGLLDRLEEFSGDLIVPSRVRRELLALKENPAAASFARWLPDWAHEVKAKENPERLPLQSWADPATARRQEIRYLIQDMLPEGSIRLLSSDDNVFFRRSREMGFVDEYNLHDFIVAVAEWDLYQKCPDLKDPKLLAERIAERVRELDGLSNDRKPDNVKAVGLGAPEQTSTVESQEPEHDRDH